MPTWSWLGMVSCNRQGNQLVIEFQVDDLGFVPTLEDSSVARNRIRAVATWRRDEQEGSETPLFLKFATGTETPQPAASIVSFVGGSTSGVARVAIDFGPTRLLSINCESTPKIGGRPSVELLGFLDVFLTLSNGTLNASSVGLNSAPFPLSITSTVAAAGIGRLPRWVETSGPLQLHADIIAARVELAPPGKDLKLDPEPLVIWPNLSETGGDLSSPSGMEATLSVPEDQGLPQLHFSSSIIQRSGNPNISGDNCTVGVVFRAESSASSKTEHLIGRWSGQSGTDNATKWQWRLAYSRTATPSQVHTLKAQFASGGFPSVVATLGADVEAPTSDTMLIYRVTPGSTQIGELWVNGVRLATVDTFLPDYNTGGYNLLSIGARYNGSAALTDAFTGNLEQGFAYSTRLTDGALSLVMYEMARRSSVVLGPVPQPTLTQPWGTSNAEPRRRLDRWPIAVINLYGGVFYDENVLSQNPAWRREDEDREKVVQWFRERVLQILNACSDFEIMINRPAGQYVDDIIPAGIFGDIDGEPETQIIKTFQWEALSGWTDEMEVEHPGVFGEFGLADYNNRDNKAAQDDPAFARRCWFYTGNPTINDDGDVMQNGRCNNRIVGPVTGEFYLENFLAPWPEQDDRFRCFFTDSASKWDRRWVEIVQGTTINEEFTLVGEAITADENARLGAVWFALVGIGKAPWWNDREKDNGYNWSWNPGPWEQSPIYVGIGTARNGVVIDLNDPKGENEADSLSVGDLYRFVVKGAVPVCWGFDYQRVGTAWYYGSHRIPVGRFNMLSPRLARVWR